LIKSGHVFCGRNLFFKNTLDLNLEFRLGGLLPLRWVATYYCMILYYRTVWFGGNRRSGWSSVKVAGLPLAEDDPFKDRSLSTFLSPRFFYPLLYKTNQFLSENLAWLNDTVYLCIIVAMFDSFLHFNPIQTCLSCTQGNAN